MRLTINIDLGNDAMQTKGDALDALNRALMVGTADERLEADDEGGIRDLNGNRVGAWKVVEV